MSKFPLTLLGQYELRCPDGGKVALATRKGWALIAALVSNQARNLSREDLAAQIWPQATETQARASLRQELAVLRKGLLAAGVDGLSATKDQLRADFPQGTVDVLEFERLLDLSQPESHRTALALYKGDFMGGLSLRSDLFEDWLWLERIRLRTRAQQALLMLLEHDTERKDDARTMDTARQLLLVEPTQEQAYRALMQLHWQAGDRADALQVYRQCQIVLRRDLDTEPSKETTKLAKHIRAETRPPKEVRRKAMVHVVPAAVLCLSIAEPALRDTPDQPLTPKMLRRAQVMFSKRVKKAAASIGARVLPGLGDCVVVAMHSGHPARDCDAAITLGLEMIADPLEVADALTLPLCGGISSGEVAITQPKFLSESNELVGIPLRKASHRASRAGAGQLLGGPEVIEVAQHAYITQPQPQTPPQQGELIFAISALRGR